MAGIRNQIERWFERMTGIIYDHRWKTLALMILFVGLFAARIPGIQIDTSTEGFLHESDPSLVDYERFRDQFGREQMLIIALEPPEVFDQGFLRKLKALHHDLEKSLPYLEEVTSLVNARNTRGKDDELIVEDLLESWPQTDQELAAVKQRAFDNAMYRNMLISEDGRLTTIVVQTKAYSQKGNEASALEGFEDDFSMGEESSEGKGAEPPRKRKYLTDEENGEVVKAAVAVLSRHDLTDIQVYMAGLPAVSHFLKTTMMRDMRKFMAVAILTIALFLLVMFRRISGVVMPIVVVILSLLSTVGMMAATGTALKLPTQILPSFILAVGVGDSVHILVIFFRRFNKSGNKKDAIVGALGHSGLAVFMTSLTTASGLMSFSTAAVAPIADLGQFASFGVMLAFVYTVVLLPALIAIVPLKPKAAKRDDRGELSFSDRLLTGIGNISIHHPYRVLGGSAVILTIAVAGIARIEFSHNPLKWLPPDNSIRLANEKIDRDLKGSTSLEIIIDTGRENGLYDPVILNRLEKSAQYLETYESNGVRVGKAWSLTTVLKEINQALHANDKRHYSIPQDRELVAQEFLLFENSGSDDLEDVTDSQFSKARFTIKVPFLDAISFTGFIDDVNAYFSENYPDASVSSTGMVAIFVRVITSAIKSLRISYGYAIIVISILMVLLIGRVRIGLLSMIPNIAPILVMLGIMGWMDIPMDLFCMLVGSIAIGLAVDDTIHFMHNFRRYFEETGDAAEAIMRSLHSTGRAMLVTTCVLAIGFFTFMFASMKNLFNFGMLTGVTIIMALLSDYFIAPALMIVVNRRKEAR